VNAPVATSSTPGAVAVMSSRVPSGDQAGACAVEAVPAYACCGSPPPVSTTISLSSAT
jgi:hypothetical protein